MTDRPLFDAPHAGAPVKEPKAKSLPVPRPKVAPESLTVTFTAAPGNDVPPIIRFRRLLKFAWRSYRLRAKVVTGEEFLTPAPHDSAGQDKPMASKACIGVNKVQRGPQMAFNKADGNEET